MKETLEMIPVAILMAILLFFGITSARDRVGASSSPSPINVAPKVAPALPTIAVPPPEPPVDSTIESRKSIFIERRESRPGVPYFTDADIVRMNPTVRPKSAPKSGTTATENGKISINTADARALTAIPGIGAGKAALIISSRPARGYTDWSEIDALPGFGTATLETMKLHAEL